MSLMSFLSGKFGNLRKWLRGIAGQDKPDPLELGNGDEVDEARVTADLIAESDPNVDFYIFLLLSTLICSLGLIYDNLVVVIGSMLVSPLLAPMLALSLGLVTTNWSSLFRSLKALLRGVALILSVSFLVGVTVGRSQVELSQVVEKIDSSALLLVGVAALSGLAAAYSWIKPRFSESLMGVVLATALLPPLCAAGISLALPDRGSALASFSIFAVSLLVFILASALVFWGFGFRRVRDIEQKEIEREQREKHG